MSGPLCIAIVNKTDPASTPLAAQLTQAYLTRVAAAMQLQLQRDVAPKYPAAAGAIVRVSDGSDIGATEVEFDILPTLADAPGAEAYHDDKTPGGVPDAFLGLDTVASLGALSACLSAMTSGLSHENVELTPDPECNLWATIPAGIPLASGLTAGMQIAYEVCDPLQDRTYPVDLGDGQPPIDVADFVYQAYFDVTLTGPTSYGEDKGLFPRLLPFNRTPGGYHLARNGDGSGETQVFGKAPSHKVAHATVNLGSRWRQRGWKPKAVLAAA